MNCNAIILPSCPKNNEGKGQVADSSSPSHDSCNPGFQCHILHLVFRTCSLFLNFKEQYKKITFKSVFLSFLSSVLFSSFYSNY